MSSGNAIRIILAIVLLGAGVDLLLPHRRGATKPRRVHVAGALLAALGTLLLASHWVPPAHLLTRGFFYGFGLLAVGAAVLTVSSRNPVHNALWFAAVLISTAGLFLLVGAQFLAAGTVIVYAGAIVVTFLFVIMLAQVRGEALYDRTARAPARSTITVMLVLGGVAYAIGLVQATPRASSEPAARAQAPSNLEIGDWGYALDPDETRLVRTGDLQRRAAASNDRGAAQVLLRSVSPTARLAYSESSGDPARGLPPPHVAGLGGTLFVDHLIAVEVAGALLFVALVGAIAIALPRRAGELPGREARVGNGRPA
jgi:NADH-quinone oxidoreductase subunit J